ncbi:MAG TPA: S46 family peptidase, partial [Bryobacteraceae bacterium]|nr:S46 family peptidase [Bryobacteraceae bacterium]
PDNFEYPRYCLDVAFFRVYENNAPAKIQHFLKWSGKGAADGELVFVSGHPGKTDRLNTIKHLEFARDMINPTSLRVLKRREVALASWSARSAENARRAQDLLFSYQNARKARDGMLAGLQDPSVMATKAKAEQELRQRVLSKPDLKEKYGSAWEQVDTALAAYKPIYTEFYLLERPAGAFNSDMFLIARDLVRYASESKKPNSERLREYSEAGVESLKQELFSEAPIYKDFEIVKLSDSLSMLVEWLGAEHELVKKVLAGKSPRERAADLVNNSKLSDVASRKQLFQGGLAAVQSSNDPMIQLVALVDPYARKVRSAFEEKVDEPLKQAYAKIAQARFAAYGSSVYPDATFTLRLSYGQVKGYTDNGQPVPAQTTFAGLYARAADHKFREPFDLPQRWKDNRTKLDLNTPYNFVTTNDIIGGNSGSPIVNRNNEIVGIIFDGNIQSLVLDYLYTDEQSRALSVHSAGILEALRKVYNATGLAGELTGSKSGS